MTHKGEAPDQLPPAVAMLWNLRQQPRRGPKPSLSVERIVAAAIEIADAEGLTALSMARVAEKLGTTAMSLYRHVRNKDELIQVMIDAAAAIEPPPEPDPDKDWRFNLEQWGRALFGLYRAHRWSLDVPIGPLPPIGPGQLAWLDRGLATLSSTALPHEVRVGVIMLLLTHIRGEVGFTQQVNQSMSWPPEPGSPTYGQLLRRLVDPARLPALAELVSDGAFDGAEQGISDTELAQELDFALAVLLDGIATLVDQFATGAIYLPPDER
jgi:AcrR family transcriptional regulator